MASRSDKPTHSNWDDLQGDEVTHGDGTSSRFLNTLQMHDQEFSYDESSEYASSEYDVDDNLYGYLETQKPMHSVTSEAETPPIQGDVDYYTTTHPSSVQLVN